MSQRIRPYERATDLDAVKRIWSEVGWTTEEAELKALEPFLDASNVEVGLIGDEAECSVAWVPGTMRYQLTDLACCFVTAVTTSRVARKQGLATSMTARSLRAGAEAGAAVTALGIFDDGFYNRIGFGTNTYHHQVSFDPSTLRVGHVPYGRPVRLGPDDYEEVHALVSRRARLHGAVVVGPAEILRAEMQWVEKPFGLGYRNSEGRLTHFLYGESKGAQGPYNVRMMAYEEPEQVLELLRLLHEMADQVNSVTMPEPSGLQLQDLIDKPFAQRSRTRSSIHAAGTDAAAWMQFRILDLQACVAARSWVGPTVRCNLQLTDPVDELLRRSDAATGTSADAHQWAGVGGRYLLEIGGESTIEPGSDPALPTLTASIGAFSRCWFGARPASSLPLSDDFAAPEDLLQALDDALALPPPHPGWDF